MKDAVSSRAGSYLLKLAALAMVYTAVVYMSLHLTVPGGSGASLVWPPTAVALAALFLFGIDLWPALFLPFFIMLLVRDVAAPTAAAVAVANTAEAVVGSFLLARTDFKPMLARLRDVFSLIVASGLGAALGASITTSILYFFGSTPGTLNTPLLVALWIGHFVSALCFGAFLMRWLCEPRATLTWQEFVERAVIFVSIGALSYFVGWTSVGAIGSISLIYILIPFFIWASLRTGSRGITLALALFSVIVTTGLVFGTGPLAQAQNPAQALFGVQILVGVLSLIFLLFTANAEERREAVRRLESHVGALETSLERVSSEDQAKTDFIAILAHELRNPLSPILSSVELMKQSGVKEEHEHHVHSIASNLHIMARLLDDLLDISRITQKKFKLQPEPVEMRTIVNQTLEIVRPYLESRKHTLEVSMPEAPIWLSADPVRLTQVFVNILNNAGKYTDPGGRIALAVEPRHTEVVVRITDTGMGIPPERLSKIFDSFGGAEGPARKPGGLHIGLSLAKRMVELHHGTIEPRSAGQGRGSEFIVRLPTLQTAPLPMETPRRTLRSRFSREAIARVTQTGPLQLLIVDDNEAAAESLGELLRKNGREVRLAYTGQDGLLRADEQVPDIALLDIGLPDMEGYDLARRMRAAHPEIKLVALTGYGQPEDRQKARDAGFDEHIVKPVAIVDLERILASLAR